MEDRPPTPSKEQAAPVDTPLGLDCEGLTTPYREEGEVQDCKSTLCLNASMLGLIKLL